MKRKIIIATIFLALLLLLTACGKLQDIIDYGYTYYFDVVGGNGSISERTGKPSPTHHMGGGNDIFNEFYATPDLGYQVKEWTINEVVVENNKTNTLSALFGYGKNYITVEFEKILEEQTSLGIESHYGCNGEFVLYDSDVSYKVENHSNSTGL